MSVNSPRFSLYKRSNKIYYISYYANGRRRWKSTGASTKSDALKAFTELRELLAEPRRVLTFGFAILEMDEILTRNS